jgi:predicted enzyme related to lactoylglutathione lyase
VGTIWQIPSNRGAAGRPGGRGALASVDPGRELENHMRANRIMANLRVSDVDAAKGFYTDFLGLSTEEFNMGWVARYTSPDTGANIQLVTHDATAPEDSVVSVHTDDVDAAYAEARELGFEIVRPLTTEAWGVRRFLVRAPDGNVVNIVNHRD